MCALLLLALSLLGGSVLLAPLIPAPALPSPPPGGIEHDGYVLVCEGVATDACRAEADLVASGIGPEGSVRWILIRPDGHEVCWTGPREAICGAVGVARPRAVPTPEEP